MLFFNEDEEKKNDIQDFFKNGGAGLKPALTINGAA